MISLSDARAIVDVVAADPASKRKITSWIDAALPDSWGWAGGLRNAIYGMPKEALSGVMDSVGLKHPTDVWEQFECNSIAQVTSSAITRAVKAKTPALRNVRSAGSFSRDTSLGNSYEHTGTLVTLVSGATVVFDWHATLAASNPMIYLKPGDFHLGKNGITFNAFQTKGAAAATN